MSTEKPKRYKLLTECLVSAIHPNELPPRGSIWTAETNEEIQEAVALAQAGYARETNEAATVETRSQLNRAPLTGIVDADKIDTSVTDAPLLELLTNSVNGVAELLPTLSAEELTRLGELELAGNQKRKGVLTAIATVLAEKNAE